MKDTHKYSCPLPKLKVLSKVVLSFFAYQRIQISFLNILASSTDYEALLSD